jgi:hypothetical protein
MYNFRDYTFFGSFYEHAEKDPWNPEALGENPTDLYSNPVDLANLDLLDGNPIGSFDVDIYGNPIYLSHLNLDGSPIDTY